MENDELAHKKLLLKILGGRIADLRMHIYQWSRAQLAEHAKLTHNHIYLIETGQRNPRFTTIRRISQAFEMSMANFFTTNTYYRKDQSHLDRNDLL